MGSPLKWIAAAGALAAAFVISSTPAHHSVLAVVEAQDLKPVTMTRLFTGSDGQTHVEEMEAKFNASQLWAMPVKGAELHRYAPTYVNDWHPAPRKQYVITLSGHGQIELADGQKITVGPGHIELAEDVTGKGHITRVVGGEDRVTLQLPVADAAGR